MNVAVIFAGGVGSRMKTNSRPKQFLEMYGKPIIVYTLEHFQNHEKIDGIVIACIEEYIDYMNNLVEKYMLTKVLKVVKGGSTGQESIYNGLVAADEIGADTVLIHDGVRPLINEKLITDCLESVDKYGSAITVSPVKETLIVLDKDSSENHIVEIPSRANSRLAKAPQCFRLDDILSVHKKALSQKRNDFIDSCSMMVYYGYELHTVDGPYENIKITTPDDYYTMRAILEAKENAQIYGYDE